MLHSVLFLAEDIRFVKMKITSKRREADCGFVSFAASPELSVFSSALQCSAGLFSFSL